MVQLAGWFGGNIQSPRFVLKFQKPLMIATFGSSAAQCAQFIGNQGGSRRVKKPPGTGPGGMLQSVDSVDGRLDNIPRFHP